MREKTCRPDRINSESYTSYPILIFNEVPGLEVRLIDRPGESCHGIGEISRCPTGVAVSNALFNGAGGRVRRFPLTSDRVKAAIDSRDGLQTLRAAVLVCDVQADA
ncbi:MAG: hypothetical protein F4Z55_05670 [Boseongicola sp. SB0667_bin_21]|nr:hypothetical protein [Boseongicola sp. SB0667_bin_21]